MSRRCTICVNFSVRQSPLRALGLYRCRVHPAWTYTNPFMELDCVDFARVHESQIADRMAWEQREQDKTAGDAGSTNASSPS